MTPQGPKTFIDSLLSSLQSLGHDAHKIRKTLGWYVTGVRVKPEVYERDRLFGAPLAALDPPKDQDGQVKEGHGKEMETSPFPVLQPDLYEAYKGGLGKTPLKEDLKKGIREELDLVSLEELAERYCKNCKVASSYDVTPFQFQ